MTEEVIFHIFKQHLTYANPGKSPFMIDLQLISSDFFILWLNVVEKKFIFAQLLWLSRLRYRYNSVEKLFIFRSYLIFHFSIFFAFALKVKIKQIQTFYFDRTILILFIFECIFEFKL